MNKYKLSLSIDKNYDKMKNIVIRNNNDILRCVKDVSFIGNEKFVTIGTDSYCNCIFVNVIDGGCYGSDVDLISICKMLLLSNSVNAIFLHNHPCGDGTATDQDWQLTITAKKAFETIGIELMEHLIVDECMSVINVMSKSKKWKSNKYRRQ